MHYVCLPLARPHSLGLHLEWLPAQRPASGLGREGLEKVPTVTQPSTMEAPIPPFVRGDDRRRGMAFMLLAAVLFSFVDAQAKYLSEHLPVLQIAWARHFGMFVAVAVVIWPRTGLAILRTRRPKLQLLRGVLVILSSVLFITAISFVPLADAVAVSFVAPLMVTVLSALILSEPVGLRRWLAVAVGFAGAMIVTRPGLGVIHPAAFLVAIAAAAFAFYQVVARLISDTEDVRTTLSYTVIVGAVILTALLPFNWVWPAGPLDAVILASIGLWAAGAEYAVLKAFVVAPGAVVAPLQYTMLVWSTLYGFLLFADLPDALTLVGAAVLIATGLYTYHREGKRAPALTG